MKILHRSVLATGIAVALVSQAPIVAFASNDSVVSIEATNPTEDSTMPTEVNVTNPSNVSMDVSITESPTTSSSYGDATVTVNDNISANANQTALSVNCDATQTTGTTSEPAEPNNLTVVIDNKTVSSQTVTTDTVTTGTAIVADGTSNVVGSNTNIIGDVINNGEGDIVINARSNSNIAMVQATSVLTRSYLIKLRRMWIYIQGIKSKAM